MYEVKFEKVSRGDHNVYDTTIRVDDLLPEEIGHLHIILNAYGFTGLSTDIIGQVDEDIEGEDRLRVTMGAKGARDLLYEQGVPLPV